MKGIFNLVDRLAQGRPPVGKTPADVVGQENKWKLLRYRRNGYELKHKTPVLLVPSLINRHYVLDLLPGRSFVEYLVKQGHDVFMINWGTPGPEDRYLEFDTICDRYLGRALRMTCKAAGSSKAHLLGYCLGGTLTSIHAAVRPERVASMVAMAAPINFHDEGLLSLWMQNPAFQIDPIIDAFGNMPWPMMQSSFHMLKPTLNLGKLVTLLDRADDNPFLDGFLAIETWGSDNISFPGNCYKTYINEFYKKNTLVNGEFYLSGERVALENIKCPVLAVTFEHDHIAPSDSCAVLLEKVSSKVKERVHLNGGHVGAVIARRAVEGLWPQLSQFWATHEVKTRKPRSTKKAGVRRSKNMSTRAAV